jgi:hypothetical protein
MESINNKNITQEGLYEATNELLDLELEKSNPNITEKELKEIEKREQEIYKLYPMLKD